MESEKVKEIKKALECCSTLMDNNATSEEQDKSCNECPYRLNDRCSWNLDGDALTLINELESENEKLKQHKRELQGGQQDLIKRIAELELGNEALSFAVKQGFNDCQKKTLKQFAERLKEKCNDKNAFICSNSITATEIDETLKEFI